MVKLWLQVGFRSAQNAMKKVSYIAGTSAVRGKMEQSYKFLIHMWASEDLEREPHLRQACTAVPYHNTVLLQNIQCYLLYGGRATTYFVRPPPTLDQYVKSE